MGRYVKKSAVQAMSVSKRANRRWSLLTIVAVIDVYAVAVHQAPERVREINVQVEVRSVAL